MPSRRPARLRELRPVEALEQMGTPAAAKVLATLIRGAPGTRRTREARATLDRRKRAGYR